MPGERVTVTISGCRKYMDLLTGEKSTDVHKHESLDTMGLTQEELEALLTFCREPKSCKEMQEFMPKWSRTAFVENVLKPLLASGRLLMTKPVSPQAPNQKYYSNE